MYVADGFTSLVSKIRRTGLVTKAEGPQPGEVAGLAFSRSGDAMAYTTTSYTDGSTTLTIKKGSKTVVADLSGFEADRNPDQRIEYGINNADDCVKGALGDYAEYHGIVESHPYAVEAWGDSWIVADAAGNDLLKVTAQGKVSRLAVLPSQPKKITADMAASEGLPDCVVGKTYRFEAVPTDVEWGQDGWLYVTTLPGGPEDPSFGDRGSVWKVDPKSGEAKRIATGFGGRDQPGHRTGRQDLRRRALRRQDLDDQGRQTLTRGCHCPTRCPSSTATATSTPGRWPHWTPTSTRPGPAAWCG